MCVEFLLKLFIRVVDAKLFEGILCKVLEPVDIQDANEGLHLVENFLGSERSVDDIHKPVKETGVDEFTN